MSGAFSEDALVEQPAVELLAGLGWQTVSAFHEVFGVADPSPLRPSPSGRGDGGEGARHEGAVSLGRESAGEVVLLRHLVPALKKLNPKAPPKAIDAAVNDLTRDLSVMSLAAANLRRTRDLLLPKLISGALDVSKLEIETA